MRTSSREQWLKNNLKPIKYVLAGGTFLATTAIGVVNRDPNTLSYAFFLATMAYTTPTIMQANESRMKQVRQSNNGEINHSERTSELAHFARHAMEPVTDTIKQLLRLTR